MSRFLLPLALFLTVSHAAIPFSPRTGAEVKDEAAEEPKIEYRLPGDVIPISYDITLTPVLEDDFKYTGKSIIVVTAKKTTKEIVLHSKGLKITAKSVIIDEKDPANKIVDLKLEEKTDFLRITLENNIVENQKLSIELEYSGKLDDNLRGFYRSSYINEAGQKRWLATTHFEPTGARLAFPCFDEPALKATFEIKIDVSNLDIPYEYNVISNMKGINTSHIFKFEKTPPMSTYLVAFVVSDFKENKIKKNSIDMSVWTRNELSKHTDYARDIGLEILKAMNDYVNVKYHFNKMEQIGIPDFSAGAMENWGLVTYREKALVHNEDTSSAIEKQDVAGIVAHEFAHQWFGDHVSPSWWKYLWLNEGFANFFQYFITDKAGENFNIMDQFVVKILQGSAFPFDITEKTHPMNAEVQSPSEISSIFDTISYQKSGSVIRMMQHFLTEDIFKGGLKNYLEKMNEKSATSDDLFNALNEKWNDKDLSVKTIMDTWVTQSGYPVITVTREENKIRIKQERFLAKKPNQTESEEKWWIPINFASEKKADFDTTSASNWLKPNESLEIGDVDAAQWVIFNKQQTGYYRVNYDKANWDLIIKYLKTENFKKIHHLNRAQLIDDAWNLARAGHLDYEIPFELTNYLENETEYAPWYSAIRGLRFLKNQLINTQHYDNFKRFALKLATKLVEEVGFVDKEGESHIMKLKRSLALDWVCGLGLQNCTLEYEKQFSDWLEDAEKNKIHKNLREIVLCASLQDANETIWDKVYEKYRANKGPFEQTEILSSLGCSRDEKILEKYLDLAVKENSEINSTTTAFGAVYNKNEIGLNVSIKYIFSHIHAIMKHDKGDDANLFKYIEDIGKMISSEQHLKELEEYINDHKLEGKHVDSALAQAHENVEWVKTHSEKIGSILSPDQEDGSGGASSLYFTTVFSLIPVFIATLF